MPPAIAPHRTVPIESVQATPTTEIGGVVAFRVGTWTDGWGDKRTWTIEEMQEAVDNYNASASSGVRRAPVLLNHDSGGRDVGWIKPTARVEGEAIVLDLEQVDLEFAADLKAGRWTYRSIGFFNPGSPYNPTPGKWNIAELSFTPIPAVDGLGTVFSSAASLKTWAKSHTPPPAKDRACFSFARSPMFSAVGINADSPKFSYWGWGFEAIAQLLQSQRDQMLASSGDVEATNTAYPADAIAAIKEMANQIFLTAEDLEMVWADMDTMRGAIADLQNQVFQLQPTEPVRGFSMATDNNAPDTTAPDHSAQFAALEEKISGLTSRVDSLTTENEALKTSNAELQAKAEAAERKAEELEVDTVLDGLEAEGRISEDDRSEFRAFALSLNNKVSTDAELSQRAIYLKQLGDRPTPSRQFSAGRIDIPNDASKGGDDKSQKVRNRYETAYKAGAN